MTRTVLVTDSLFVFDEHVDALRQAGYTVRRIDKPRAPDAEIIAGIRDAEGYILGGIERLNSEILQQAAKLRAVAFTGSGYREFIPAHDEVTRRGIPIAAAKGANKNSVAEFTLALILTMMRDLPNLMSPGEVKFATTPSAEDAVVGVIGMGAIGSRVAELCSALGFKVLACARSGDVGKRGEVEFVTKQELIARADIVSLHVSVQHGVAALDAKDIEALKKGTIIVNAAFPEAADEAALVRRLRNGELKAAFDAPMHHDVSGIPRTLLLQSNMQTAFNTRCANKRTSDWVTRAMIAMLNNADDPLIVNPDYKKHIKT